MFANARLICMKSVSSECSAAVTWWSRHTRVQLNTPRQNKRPGSLTNPSTFHYKCLPQSMWPRSGTGMHYQRKAGVECTTRADPLSGFRSNLRWKPIKQPEHSFKALNVINQEPQVSTISRVQDGNVLLCADAGEREREREREKSKQG